MYVYVYVCACVCACVSVSVSVPVCAIVKKQSLPHLRHSTQRTAPQPEGLLH